MELITHVLLTTIFGFSFAVLLVEKGDDWPVTIITTPLRWLFNKISEKLYRLMFCTVCASFWCSLFGELILYFFYTGKFMWPFTGVIALGVTWMVIEYLNALDKSSN